MKKIKDDYPNLREELDTIHRRTKELETIIDEKQEKHDKLFKDVTNLYTNMYDDFNVCDNPPCLNHVDLRPCSRCRLVYYCSKECQSKDWLSHKPFCVPRGGKTRSKKHKIKKSRKYK